MKRRGPSIGIYRHHEFMPLAEHPNKLFIAMGTVEKAFRTR